ncbi:DUF4194 domain-containing protein [Tenacibaculum finnmarkense genomovar ulcerans]|uniref:DUF4194 domain-containing protein n=1 Tax=Tenacibaculum finnmarkense TaxID=2781243 RepID=UPI001E3CD164|nr:DUF4194 domain-containing protein [Tenacibaculum finnmarkense]MCD8454226.1 DUF4194 domain-containing protein [Tenacibaculum finnmarkense genomovar ulcerans]
MKQLHQNIKPYSKAIVKLLKGTVNKNESIWNDILIYQNEIQEYISKIGLELIVKENDGFAFLKQFEIDNDNNTIGISSRRQVGFETSIVLVILRQIIEEFENDPTNFTVTEKYITASELKEQIGFFIPENYNTIKVLKNIETYIKNVEKLGYLKEIGTSEDEKKYIIHKIIKEKITLDILNEFKENLKNYVETI